MTVLTVRPPVQRAPQNPNVFKHTMPDMSRYYSKKAPVVSNKLGEMIKKARNTQMIDALIDREKTYKYPMYDNPAPPNQPAGMLPPPATPTQSVIYQNPNTNQRNSTVARRDSMPPLMRGSSTSSASSRSSRSMSGVGTYEPAEYFYPALDIDDPFDDSNVITPNERVEYPTIQEPEDPFSDANETRLIDQPVYYPEIDEGLVIEQGPAPTGRSPISSPIITYPESPVLASGRMNLVTRNRRIGNNRFQALPITPTPNERRQNQSNLKMLSDLSKAVKDSKYSEKTGTESAPLAITAGPYTENRKDPVKPVSVRKEKRASGYMYRDAKKQKTK